MPYLTPGVSINPGEVVTRQTIYDVLGLAGLGSAVNQSELDSSVITITTQSLPPASPSPGMVWFDQSEQLLKVWTDVLENTGVSCWLAFGPDAFDVALYATESIPYGAGVIPAPNLGTRACMLPTDPGSLAILSSGPSWSTVGRYYNLQFLALNCSPHPILGPYNANTAPSGTWFAARLYGTGVAWAVASRGNPTSDSAWGTTLAQNLGFASGASGFCNPSGISNIRGALTSCGTDWTTGDFPGGVFAIALHRAGAHKATQARDYYGAVLLNGVRIK